jgi:hypothetical protein
MAKYQQGFPVNENGEIVVSGTNQSVVGVLPIDMLPVDDSGGLKLGNVATLATDAGGAVQTLVCRASPASGVATVTGTTTEQFFELVDISGLLKTNDSIVIDSTIGYTGSTNAKTITYYIGPNTSSLSALAATNRTSGTEVVLRSMFEFFVHDMSTIGRIGSALGTVGTGSTAVSTLSIDIAQPALKLFIGLKLALGSETITLHKYAVRLERST